MRIKVHCQNRVGILRDILNLLVDYGINVNRGEVGGDQGNAIYLLCPNMINLQLQSLRPKLEAVPGVFGVKRVGLMPSERRHLELNALLAALDFPVLSVDMGGQIVAANRAAAQLLGVRVDEVPGIPLSRYVEDLDLPELVRANKARINGLRVKVKGDVFLADIAPLQSEHDESEALAGAVLTLHRADRVGERIYHVRKQELRGFDSIFQSSRVMAAVVREARRMAPLDAPLLIEGETGTGKELLARQIHRHSERAGLFVAVSCSALSRNHAEAELFGYAPGAHNGPVGSRAGWFGSANGGTLYLDEIADLRLTLQARLLQTLEEREVLRVGAQQPIPHDVRLVTATSVDLDQAVRAGKFLAGLQQYLHDGRLSLPPLRERPGDILPLAEYFIGVYAQRLDLPVPAIGVETQRVLESYPWPGNIRELENVVHFALLVSDKEEILPQHLNFGGATPDPSLAGLRRLLGQAGAPSLEQVQALLLQLATEQAGGDEEAGRRRLGLAAN